jgi:predicted enzyme related to lactoylglutathione lyase
MQVTGVDFVAVPTQDYESAKKFYEETLGLPFSKQWGDMPAGEFETANLTIALMQSDAFGQEFKPHTAPLEFRVDDVAASREELEGKGVKFMMDTIDSGVCYQAIFQDPDGNVLALHQRYSERSPQEAAAREKAGAAS